MALRKLKPLCSIAWVTSSVIPFMSPEKPRPTHVAPVEIASSPAARQTDLMPYESTDAELRAALGVPSDCVRDYDAPKPTKIRISVSGIASIAPRFSSVSVTWA